MITETLREGESIVIDTPEGKIEVRPVRFLQGKVRIGIVAPRDIHIVREELTSNWKPVGGRKG